MHLEVGDAGGARRQLHLGSELRGVGPVAAADRVEMQRQAGRRDRIPDRVPPGIPQRRHVVPAGDLEAARHPAPGDALDLADGRLRVVVRDAGEAGIAIGMGGAEIGEPFVVDAQHLAGRLVVLEPDRGTQDAVEHLGLHAVALLVLEPQFGIGRAADALLAVVIEPGRRHPVRAMDLAGDVLPAARAHAVHQPERGTVLGDPLFAARPVGHVRHAVFVRRAGILDEEVGRQPDQIDMAVGRDDVVFHFFHPPCEPAASMTRAKLCATEISTKCGKSRWCNREANTPLSDVTVLDFGQIFQGPYASFLMAKAGAFVIKIEPPRGEPGRRRAEPGKSATLPFAMLNQNKHAITLNLKHERGRALLERMVERADVLLENFSPGTMDDLGVGWSRLHAINPRLIYATGTGFGISGPDRDNLAMDMTIQAASGIMSVTGFPDGPPVKAGPTLVDFMGGIHLYAGIVTALYDRDRSGVGRLVEVAMQEAVYPTLAASYDYYYRTGEIPPRTGNRQSGLNSAPYNVFPTADGHVAIHIVTEAHLQNLLKAMGREELADDPRFATNAARVANMDETDALVAAWTRTLPKMEVFARTKAYRIPCAPVRNAPEVMNDPHMHERGMLERVDHPEFGEIVVPSTPLRLHGTDRVETRPSPTIGQHNAEIYGGWLGLSAARLRS